MSQQIRVDRASIFSELCRRNALRREAHLPPLNVPAEYARLVDVARWNYVKERHYTETRAEVLASLRATHGPDLGNSAGGRWMIEILTARALTERYWR